MKWHVIVRVGAQDSYSPGLSNVEPRIFLGLVRPGDPWAIWNKTAETIIQSIGRLPSLPARDLLNLALAVYAADLRIPRSSAADRWTREVVLHLPVTAVELWRGVLPVLVRTLTFLTGDLWDIQLRSGEVPTAPTGESKLKKVETVCLFSGGLDSLIGAIDMLEEGRVVALVGHYGAGLTGSIQRDVLLALTKRYGSAAIPVRFYVQPAKRKREGEPTMRSRSFLFLALAVAVVDAIGDAVPLTIAENGLISLNVPLTPARMGSLSTRTTHPHFVGLYSNLLEAIGLPSAIHFPYRFQTKGEMLRGTRNSDLLETIAPLTMSCAHPQADRYASGTPGHCGYCVPCIIRRAALKAAGMEQEEYALDILSDPPDATTEKGRDLRAFQMAIERLRGAKPRRFLFDVLATGPVPAESAQDYGQVYARGMNEVSDLLGSGKIP
jgi:7-cyano-7-deazaguanine synthase in queuosine biosynthesis